MNPRSYQLDAKRAVFEKLAASRSTLVEMATGLGKTCLFAWVAQEWPGRVLVIAHRDELIRQAAEKIHAITGHHVAVEMGRERAEDALFGTKITVASVQTLARATRRSRFHPDHFSLMVIDEGHHAVANTYREVMDYFRSTKRLLVTATPRRADKIGMHNVCDSVAYQYGIEPAIDDGWLVPIQQLVVQVEGLDFSKARTVADDFNQGDLDRILTEEKPLHAMCSSAYELIGQRQALWFCASVMHAKAMAAVLGRYAGTVQFLSGDTPIDERRKHVDAYKAGKIQHLLNCALFLEGFDAPATSAVVMGRPTKSLGLYMQVLGRGTRPLFGVVDGIDGAAERRTAISLSAKPNMMVIDFAGNAGKHKIIQAVDVLGGKHDDDVKSYAKRTLAEDGKPYDVAAALDRAHKEMALESEEQERRKKIVAQAVYHAAEVSPFIRRHQSKRHAEKKTAGQSCSDKQAGYICYLARQVGERWTFADAKQLSPRQASGVITRLKAKKSGAA